MIVERLRENLRNLKDMEMMDSKVVLDIENHKIYCTIQISLIIK